MIKTPSAQPANAARPHRRSLADMAILPESQTSAEEGPASDASAPSAGLRPAASGRGKYPSATVYLPRRAIRLIKEIGIEEDRRISDILAEAIDEYLVKRGHASLKDLAE